MVFTKGTVHNRIRYGVKLILLCGTLTTQFAEKAESPFLEAKGVKEMVRRKRRGWNEGSVYQRSDGSWRAQVTEGGKRISFSGKTKTEVESTSPSPSVTRRVIWYRVNPL